MTDTASDELAQTLQNHVENYINLSLKAYESLDSLSELAVAINTIQASMHQDTWQMEQERSQLIVEPHLRMQADLDRLRALVKKLQL